MPHEHKPGEWCSECADAQDIAGLAKYDYQTRTWYHDGHTAHRYYLDGSSGGRTEPVPQGTYWLVDRVTWYHPGAPVQAIGSVLPRLEASTGALVVTLVASAMLDSTDVGMMLAAGVYDFSHPYTVQPGGTLIIEGVPGSVETVIEYRIRTIVPAPSETRKRLFFTPVITPDDGGEQSGNSTPESRPLKPMVTELDSTAFKTSGV